MKKTVAHFFTFILTLSALTQPAGAGDKDDKSVNLSISPVGLLFGSANLAADFGITESITIGPSISYSRFTLNSNTAQSYSFGAQSVFFLGHRRFTDGWFVTPFFQYSTSNSSINTSSTGISFGANIGYWWFYESGINIGLGLGLQYLSIDLAALGVGTASGGATIPSALVQFGYTF